MLYLVLFDRGARDWIDKTRIGSDKTGASINRGFEPQWHHIYPRAILREAKVQHNEIHALANITVLNERTNVNKLAGKHPSDYIQQFRVSEQDLRSHLIPEAFIKATNNETDLRMQWSVERYTDFLIERAGLLAQECKRFLEKNEQLIVIPFTTIACVVISVHRQ